MFLSTLFTSNLPKSFSALPGSWVFCFLDQNSNTHVSDDKSAHSHSISFNKFIDDVVMDVQMGGLLNGVVLNGVSYPPPGYIETFGKVIQGRWGIRNKGHTQSYDT